MAQNLNESMMDPESIQVPDYDEDLDENFSGPGLAYPEFFDYPDEQQSLDDDDIRRDHTHCPQHNQMKQSFQRKRHAKPRGARSVTRMMWRPCVS